MANLVPALTSNTAPPPWVASETSASSTNSGAWRAFDKLLTNSAWLVAAAAGYPQSMQIRKSGSAIAPTRFRFLTFNNVSLYTYPATFELFYSDDGIIWNSAGSHSIPDTLSPSEWSPYFNVTPLANAEYWRLRVDTIHAHGGELRIAELELDDTGTIKIPVDGGITPHLAGALDYTASGTVDFSGGETEHVSDEMVTQLTVAMQGGIAPHLAGALDYTASGTVALNSGATIHTADKLDTFISVTMSPMASVHLAGVVGYGINSILTPPPLLTSASAISEASFYINPSATIPSTTIYRLKLTGIQNGVDDFDLPISSVQSRLRVGNNYLSAIVPNVQAFATEIGLRPDGQLVLQRGAKFQDGTEQLVEIARVNYDRLEISQGATSVSGTISGNRDSTDSTGKTIDMASGSFFSSGTGSRRYTTNPDFNIRAGDTVVVPETSETYVAGQIAINVSPGIETMTVTEVE